MKVGVFTLGSWSDGCAGLKESVLVPPGPAVLAEGPRQACGGDGPPGAEPREPPPALALGRSSADVPPPQPRKGHPGQWVQAFRLPLCGT